MNFYALGYAIGWIFSLVVFVAYWGEKNRRLGVKDETAVTAFLASLVWPVSLPIVLILCCVEKKEKEVVENTPYVGI